MTLCSLLSVVSYCVLSYRLYFIVFFVVDCISLYSLLSSLFHRVLRYRFYFIVFFVVDCMLVRSLMLSVRVCHCVLFIDCMSNDIECVSLFSL